MEMTQGNSLCSYLKEKGLFFFSFIKSEARRARQVLPGGIDTSGKGEEVNTVQILCTHV
jgi:hypothetical protein